LYWQRKKITSEKEAGEDERMVVDTYYLAGQSVELELERRIEQDRTGYDMDKGKVGTTNLTLRDLLPFDLQCGHLREEVR
jgi:hypothetical protein